MLQNRPQESWNEVNSMPTHIHDFGVICGLIWQNRQRRNASGLLNCPRTLLLDIPTLCCGYFCFFYIHREYKTQCMIRGCCCLTPLIHTHMELTLIISFESTYPGVTTCLNDRFGLRFVPTTRSVVASRVYTLSCVSSGAGPRSIRQLFDDLA